MSSGPEDSGEYARTPSIIIGDLALSRDNTVLRKFAVGDGEYDHCVVTQPDGQTVCFKPMPVLLGVMSYYEFPVSEAEELDQAAIDFYVAFQAQVLEQEGPPSV